jgi:hypothetical protein
VKAKALMLVLGIALMAAVGCGGGGQTIEGKVVNGGQPFSPEKDGDVNVGLTAVEGGKNYSGKAGADGTFKIEKVPSGKYDVNVTRYPKMDPNAKQTGPPPAAGNKKYPEQWEVSSSNKTFTLDLTKLK